MNYADTVERVMALLKERKVCSSSRKSHRDCYESLGLYLTRNNTEYTAKSHDEWFIEIKKKLPSQRCLIWIWYAYQLEEMDSSGTLSDRSLYLNQYMINFQFHGKMNLIFILKPAVNVIQNAH